MLSPPSADAISSPTGLAIALMLAGIQLLSECGILVAFTDYNRNAVRLELPLTIGPQHVDMLVEGLDDLLSQGLKGLAAGYLRRRYRSQITEPLTPASTPAVMAHKLRTGQRDRRRRPPRRPHR